MCPNEFAGRAHAYAQTRPGYPEEAVEYVLALAPPGAVFADIGAGTGKFTVPLARRGKKIYAVEPDVEMREQLDAALAPFSGAKTIAGSAEDTTLPARSVDVIVCAQALNWFDIEAFRVECKRIGGPTPMIVSLYNRERGDMRSAARYEKSTAALYKKPAIREFDNPIRFTRENWLLYLSSMAGVPQASDPEYSQYCARMNEVFDRKSADGLIRLDLVTKVYSKRL